MSKIELIIKLADRLGIEDLQTVEELIDALAAKEYDKACQLLNGGVTICLS
jgi:hypothetical protein